MPGRPHAVGEHRRDEHRRRQAGIGDNPDGADCNRLEPHAGGHDATEVVAVGEVGGGRPAEERPASLGPGSFRATDSNGGLPARLDAERILTG